MSIWDERKIDCHHHVIDPSRFPYQANTAYRPVGQEIAPTELLFAAFRVYGVQHGLIVGTNSGYGTDNACMLDAVARSDGRLKGIAVVPNDIGIDALAGLQAQGVVGVAFNPSAWGLAHYRDAAPLVARLAELGLFLQLQTEQDQMLGLMEIIGDTPVRLLIDHCGRPDMARGVAQPGFQTVLALGREGRAWVKLSGYVKFSRTPYPHPDVAPYLTALVEAYTLDRCLWGSDWPYLKADEHSDYGMNLALIADWFPDPADRARLLWETPARLFGF
jgi:predicted TIM-barrel fold metal-dependent hydrolase